MTEALTREQLIDTLGSPSLLDFELPWPPSENEYRRCAVATPKGGKPIPYSHKTTRAKKYAKQAAQAMLPQGVVNKKLTGDLIVFLTFHPPTRRPYDIDNPQKGLFDAITTAGVWEDDVQVRTAFVDFGEVVRHGRVLVTIKQRPTT